MKEIKLSIVVLVVVFLSSQVAVTSSDVSSFDYMSDINRDGTVDIHDLCRLGEAYGSSLVLPSEPNKTVVTVLSFAREPPEVENARVAIIDPEVCEDAINVTFTNSSGIATFDLSSNKNYTAIAWSGAAYNYANFTTNSFSEASVPILLGEPALPTIRALPQRWIALSFLDNDTGLPWLDSSVLLEIGALTAEIGTWHGTVSYDDYIWSLFIEPSHGVFIILNNAPPLNEPYSSRGVRVWGHDGRLAGFSVYYSDENGCANVVVYVTPP